MSKKEIMESGNSELAVQNEELDLNSILGDSGAGSENVTADDTKTPFLRIIQALSPQHQKAEPEYIEGAEQGMLFNTITNQVYGEEGVTIVPVHYETRFIEKMRKSDGKTTEEFVADHGTSKGIVEGLTKEGFAYVTADNNLIYPTATEYVLTLDKDNIGTPAVMSFPSTLADQSRRLNTVIAGTKYPPVKGKAINAIPPRWYKSFQLTTQIKTNGQNKWHIYKITESDPIIKITDDGKVVENVTNGLSLYSDSKSFKQLIYKGEVEVQHFVDEELSVTTDNAPF